MEAEGTVVGALTRRDPAVAGRPSAVADDGSGAPALRLLVLAALLVGACLALGVGTAAAATTRTSEAPITEANGEAFVGLDALTVDSSDHLWLTESTRHKVIELDPTGAFLHENDGTGSWEDAERIDGLAFDEAAGRIYVADGRTQSIIGIEASDASNTSPLVEFGAIPGARWAGELRDAADNSGGATDGDLYVLGSFEPGHETVSRIHGAGPEEGQLAPFAEAGNQTYITSVAEGGSELTGPFRGPESIATDAAGDIYVGAENGIFVFAPSGRLIQEFTQFDGPATTFPAIAVDPTSDSILVAQNENLSGTTAILELSPSGTLEDKITEAGGTALGGITGLAVDSTGTLYASEAANARIDVFGPAQNLPPSSDGGSVAEVSADAATLRGEIDPSGHPTTYQFEFGPSPCSAIPTSCRDIPATPVSIGSGHSFVSVSQTVAGLSPGTTYYYRLIVEDTEGDRLTGPDRSFTTQTTGLFSLPDYRQWELVSPPRKLGAAIRPLPGAGTIEAAAGGDAITYLATAPTEADPPGNPRANVQVLSVRTASGWISKDIPLPAETLTSTGGEGIGPEDYIFNPDLSQVAVQPTGPFRAGISSQASEETPYLRTNFSPADPDVLCSESCYRPLVTSRPGFEDVPPGTVFAAKGRCVQPNLCGPELLGASTDLKHIVIDSTASLAAGAPTHNSLYEWSEGRLQLISILPGAAGPAPAGSELELGSSIGSGGRRRTGSIRNAISTDGSRVIWSGAIEGAAAGRHLYLRDLGREETLQLDTIHGGTGEGPAAAALQVASADDSVIYFSDEQQLTADSQAGLESPDLYRCAVHVGASGALECSLTDLTPGIGGEAGDLLGAVLGASDDGSYAYFVADGDLTGAETNGQGEKAVRGDCGTTRLDPSPAEEAQTCSLYLQHGATTTFVANLSDADYYSYYYAVGGQPTRVSPDGRWLAFMSQRQLTAYDNRDQATGRPVAEVYLYDAEDGRMVCPSCDPSGSRPHGEEAVKNVDNHGRITWPYTGLVSGFVPARVEMKRNFSSYQARYLSNSGRLFFDAKDGLVPGDSNGAFDVYEYERPGSGSCTTSDASYGTGSGGCVGLISSGTSPEESIFLDASESGDDVFFLTTAQLSKRDTDTADDVYDARLGGGEAEPAQPVVCEGDGCQHPASPPDHPTPGTALVKGPGNVLRCSRKKVEKSGKCVGKQHKKTRKHKKKTGNNKQAKRHNRSKPANSHRGGHR